MACIQETVPYIKALATDCLDKSIFKHMLKYYSLQIHKLRKAECLETRLKQ